MPYLKFHPGSATLPSDGPLSIADEQRTLSRLHMVPAAPAASPSDMINEVERAIDLVDRRLKNLRNLADQFGIDAPDDGPRVA